MKDQFNRKCLSLFIILTLFIAAPLFAQRKITIRLASLVPENTEWGAAINRMAAEWERITNKEVEVIVFHNAIAGDEPDVLNKMRINQIQAAVLTSMGMNSIIPEIMSLSYPFMIRDDDELDEVMRQMKTRFDENMQKTGYVTLAWARAGWVKFFSRTPVLVPDDLKKLKLATGADDQQMIQAFRIMGYQMIPVNLPELIGQLNSGGVDAVYQSPVYAAGGQVFGILGNMAEMNVAPFMGGIVMTNAAWRRIPEKYRAQLLEACRKIESEIDASIASLEAEAVNTMVKYGLKINTLTPQQVQAWHDDTARYETRLLGGASPVFNREYVNMIRNILTEYRKGR
ncbi:MAG: TRAP transporter substrate-binding protein DctP [Treponema sp.]|jgi:TRAP-type C4-dicarboxylate transport system substrate-binding protein|nr:TRAP transporter substrate-binding protein DctP [Treponema sp.]